MEDLNDMLYFAEVAERGGFAAAGRALGVPKSRLSRRVAELEARLGVRLLQRTTRKLSLTKVGDIYLRHCSAMRNEALAAADAVAHLRVEPRGLLRVTCPVTLAQSTLGNLIPRYLAMFPRVKLDLRVTNRAIDLVDEGIDVALRVRPSLDDSGSLVVKPLGATSGHLLASPEQLRRQGTPATPADLAGLDTIAMSSADGKSAWVLVGPEGQEFTFHHQPRYVADDLQTLKLAVLAGTGVSFLPDSISQAELQAQLLVPVLPGWAPLAGMVHAVFPARRGQMPAVRSFLDFLGQHMHGDKLVVSASPLFP
ncbi:Transcriptional regulator, LysR family [Polaromonas sp. CG9_12]|uniref:LysR substrate-binding domain-containing protein n=1 Tax=Polaromonas sp. CG_9.11 TaxID=2787730 RepID=UPI0004DDCFA7|nr:LysR substrate-binding domain-containing protein [Polaromonas sp. CG_9.11]MBG6074920.1 DNA-binding transcriptional LysR family regulator [Polaromonas sp. CG_9.11]CDS54910.1 Transcriptional regulator, LysR family [Polaromonas sp. CG9_12]